jgi:3-oxoacyl-[acyl-carrier protein] reductase
MYSTDMSARLSKDRTEAVLRRSPLHQRATVGDIAAAIEYLFGPSADRITGTNLTVEGGSTA